MNQLWGGKPFWRSKYGVAAHIALVYIGVNYYVQSIVKQEQQKREMMAASTTESIANNDRTTNVILPPKITAIPEDIKGASFNDLAEEYDGKVKWDEFVMGLGLFRKRLLSHAKGDVLEIACGTGRNIPYYPSTKQINSVTFVDSSRPMLEQTVAKYEEYKNRFLKYVPWSFSSLFLPAEENLEEISSNFYRMNAGELDFANDSFDTVIDTFGLCSVSSAGVCDGEHDEYPVKVLNEMARVCKPDGQVLLLEHGRGTWSFINANLDTNKFRHYEKWGCWWNRDIQRLVEKSDLEIVYYSRFFDLIVSTDVRFHFGTTSYMICKKKKIL